MQALNNKHCAARVRTLIALLLAAATIPSLQAVATLTLSSGADSPTISDTDGDGIIEFSGAVGNFDLNFTIGTTKPTSGTDAQPWMDVLSLNANTGVTGGTLTLRFEDDAFTGTPLLMEAGIAGTTDGSIIYNTYVNDVLFTTSGTLAGASFSDVRGDLLTAASGYKLTLEAIITHNGGNQTSSFDAQFKSVNSLQVNAPDGGATALLLGIGILASAGFSRRAAKS